MNYIKLKFHKLTHWEYWHTQFVYFPIFIVWVYYAFKAKSFFFFNAANPSIKNGGMAMESKKEIYDIIPPQYIPKTILIKHGTLTNEIIKLLANASIHFPLIAKPDIGMKAFAVDKINNENELLSYASKIKDDFLIQDLIEFPNEIGIFYVRFPDEQMGRITGIVSKEFLSVTGNGVDTILNLIKQNPRSYFQLCSLAKKYGDILNSILPKGEQFILVPYGSHTRGAKFIDITYLQSEKLLQKINSICIQINGFNYGRLDIRYNTLAELSDGKNFSIIEINGAGSEPTHIYDPNHSILFAWKEIIYHWKLLYQVSIANNKKGHPYLSFADGRAMFKANSKLEAQLKLI